MLKLHPLVRIAALERFESQQKDKVIANLETRVSELEEKLKGKQARIKAKNRQRVQFKANKSWRNSAWLGLREGLWFAPLRLINTIGVPLITSIVGTFGAVIALIVWVAGCPILIVAGLVGRLSDGEKHESDQV